MTDDAPHPHPFDESLQIRGSDSGQLALATDERYWNLQGPFGGWLLAAGLKAVLDDPRASGTPREAHARFLAAPKSGELRLDVENQSQGRSVGFWRVGIGQSLAARERLCAEISVILAEERQTLAHVAARMPAAPPPDEVHPANTAAAPLRWLRSFRFCYVQGAPFKSTAENTKDGTLESLLWIRTVQPRAHDWIGLAAFADVPAPRVFLLQERPGPVATVSLSLYFHATAAEVAASGPWLLLKITAHTVQRGFFDHCVELWSEEGILLATSTQLAWFA